MRFVLAVLFSFCSILQSDEDHELTSLEFDLLYPTVDAYLEGHALTVLEGRIGGLQDMQIEELLESHPEIQTIAEIGFNAGHSAERFLKSCKNLKKLVSFDINHWPYVKPAAEYISKKYNNVCFTFVEGDSKVKVRLFSALFHQTKFDLIFIDGGHDYETAFADIMNCKALAHPSTILWIDDYNTIDTVKAAVDKCVKKGIIEIDRIHWEDPSWIEAHYLF